MIVSFLRGDYFIQSVSFLKQRMNAILHKFFHKCKLKLLNFSNGTFLNITITNYEKHLFSGKRVFILINNLKKIYFLILFEMYSLFIGGFLSIEGIL